MNPTQFYSILLVSIQSCPSFHELLFSCYSNRAACKEGAAGEAEDLLLTALEGLEGHVGHLLVHQPRRREHRPRDGEAPSVHELVVDQEDAHRGPDDRHLTKSSQKMSKASL